MTGTERGQAQALLAGQAGWGRLTPAEQERAVTVLLSDWAEFGKVRGLQLADYANTEWRLTFLADVLDVSIPDLDSWRTS